MGSIKKFLKSIDIFGQQISLKLKTQSKTTTSIGGFLTILIISLLLASAWTTGIDLFYHELPSVNVEEHFLSKTPYYNLNSSSLPISLAVQDYDQRTFENESYFRLEVIHNTLYNSNATIFERRVKLNKCTYENFPQFSQEDIDKNGELNYFCIKDQNLTIGGEYTGEKIEYLVFRLMFCQNDTLSNITCAPIEDIKNVIINNRVPITLSLYAQSSLVNTQKYKNPMSYFFSVFYKNLVIGEYKMYNLYVKEQEISTDEGILFQDFTSQSSFAFDNADSDSSPGTDSIPLCDINFYALNKKTVYRRNYVKIQEILANVGGLTKALLIAGQICTFYFAQNKRNIQILNKIIDYDFSGDTKCSQPSPGQVQGSLLNRERSTLVNNLFTNPNVTENKNQVTQGNFIGTSNLFQSINAHSGLAYKSKLIIDNKCINPEEKIKLLKAELKKNSKEHKLKFSYLEMIEMLVCAKCQKENSKKKILLYEKSLKILEKFIDLGVIVHKLEELDRLKFVLFNYEQLALFQFISKEPCTAKDSDWDNSEISKYKEILRNEDKLITLILNFQEKFQKKRENDLDKQLVNLLSNDLKPIFFQHMNI